MRFPFLSPFLVALSLLSAPANLPAQDQVVVSKSVPVSLPADKDKYAGEPFVFERSDWVYSENADGTGYREHTIAVRMQSEPALREFGVISIPFASASEHVEFKYVRVKHADGTMTETSASDVIEQPEPVTKEAPFYSDLKDAQLPVKNLKVGDTLEWQARIVRTRAEAKDEFWGQQQLYDEDVVILDQTVELRIPAAVKVNVWTNPKSGLKPMETTDGDRKVYRWSLMQLKPTTGAEADAAKKLKKGKVLTGEEETDAEEGKFSTVAWTTFPSWEAVGAWYRGLEANRALPDEEVKAKVAELTKNSKTEEEKVRAVYAYVSAQVRYVGVAFGVGRYQPHEAADVLHNQYGDCKDKATLLSSMLETIGLKPDEVLIGAGIRFNEAVPSPEAFNHLINRVKVGDDEVWLDATQEVAPYRALLYEIRDKQALVVPATGPSKIERSPKDLPFTAYQTWTAKGTVSADGTVESHITFEARSDGEIMLRMYVHQIPPSGYDQFIQQFVGSLGYAGTASHPEISRPEDTSGPLVISFDYKREKNEAWDNLKIVPEFPPMKMPFVDEKEPPTHALELGAPVTHKALSELKIPAGWRAELPEAIHEKSPWATVDLTYRFDNGTIYAERTQTVLQSKVPASEWKAYKKFTDAIDLGYDKFIVLLKPGATAAAVSTAHAHKTDPEAEKLIDQSYDMVNKERDLKKADELLKQAKSMDPEARGLYAAMAWAAFKKGKFTESEEDYRKELALYPGSYWVYEWLARAEWAHKEKDAAIATLRELTADVPENAEAWNLLAAFLLEYEKYGEAVEPAQKAVTLTRATDKEELERRTLLLGQVQIRAGQKDAGTATLKGLLETSESAGMLNDAAYYLADEKLLLPLDEEKSREALRKLDAETQTWTLDENPATLLQKSNLLVASWDTYGWILYRAGKNAEAKSWILPAYLNEFHPDVKKHLDEIDGVLGVPKETDDTPKTQLVARTVALGAYSGGKATAEYRVLLQHGKVLRAQATGVDMPFAEELLKAVSFARLMPAGTEAKLVRVGIVNCVGGKCEFVMEP